MIGNPLLGMPDSRMQSVLSSPTPEQDSTCLEDARFSAIVYKPSDIANASGPHVHDPRSGEIIESHINWYHNVMSLCTIGILFNAHR